jgi:hypothetical protein
MRQVLLVAGGRRPVWTGEFWPRPTVAKRPTGRGDLKPLPHEKLDIVVIAPLLARTESC